MYQPIYNLDDLSVVGVEALLRWEHPTRGLVQPDEFIPILEADRPDPRGRAAGCCARHASRWQPGAPRRHDLDVSVNVSGRQLDSDTIVDDIRDALAESGLDAASLIIEVTETALMRNATPPHDRLHAIKDLGVRIAVDDFGTGYSALAYLQRFPVDCLKIDRSFTDAITPSPESNALIDTLVQLGKDLGLKTLAEGVETTEQIDHLRGEARQRGPRLPARPPPRRRHPRNPRPPLQRHTRYPESRAAPRGSSRRLSRRSGSELVAGKPHSSPTRRSTGRVTDSR